MSRMLRQYLETRADRIEAVLLAHHAPGRVTGGTVGPRLIRFLVQPAPETRYAAIRALADDLAVALNVNSLRIERTDKGIILEIPNPEPRPVTFTGLWPEVEPLPPATALLGLTDAGAPLLARLSSPEVAHVLVAGTTGSGKTALLQTMATSLALANTPETLRLLCFDPKGRAFRALAAAPHLTRSPVVDIDDALEALRSLVRLMELRDRRGECQPRIVVFVDEVADLIIQDERYNGRGSVEPLLTRLVQRGREAGIHLVAATQRPSAAVLSGLLRANFPLRLVGKVVTADDARIASGRAQTDAHLLDGRGDFVAVGGTTLIRFQGAYLPEVEARGLLADIRQPAPVLEFPEPEPEAEAPGSVELLAERLRPWWEIHGGEWGSKTKALRFLFGDQAPVAGSYWRALEAAIAQIESTTTTARPSMAAFSLRDGVETG